MFCCGHKFSISTVGVCRKYYLAVYSINSQYKCASEPVELELFELYCLPVLTYAMEVVIISQSRLHALNVCWNDM